MSDAIPNNIDFVKMDGGFTLIMDFHLPVEDGVVGHIYNSLGHKVHSFISETDDSTYTTARDWVLENHSIFDGGEEVLDIVIDGLLHDTLMEPDEEDLL